MRFEVGNAKSSGNVFFWCYDKLLACVMAVSLIFAFHSTSFAQSPTQPPPKQQPSKQKPKQPKPPRPKKPPKIKPDYLTLRYKPGSGTILYNVHTEIGQHIDISRNDSSGSLSSNAELSSDAQLALHTVSSDYRRGLWSFEQFFTNFRIKGCELSGDSIVLRENMAVNRITSLTYDLLGGELDKQIKDTLKLLNAESQTNAYFFEPPRMLIPLPEHVVTYGDTWSDHSRDSVQVRDTVNIGITTGGYTYDVTRTFRLTALRDTMGQYLAIIVVTDTGTFNGSQTNSVTGVTQTASGPISGTDTTLLDMASGKIVRRTLNIRIPALVKVFATDERKAATVPFIDIVDVRSVVALDESNVTKLPGGGK